MDSTCNIVPTANPACGFYGTMGHHIDAGAAWCLEMTAVAGATGCTQDEVRDFLDSRHGRHFADDVINVPLLDRLPLADAIAAAITKWIGWVNGRATAREYGIPRGLPYLTGFIMHATIEAEGVG